jgi:hypothetical protein
MLRRERLTPLAFGLDDNATNHEIEMNRQWLRAEGAFSRAWQAGNAELK